MEYKSSVNLTDGSVKIFGTMDGFSIVKWILKVENSFDVDACCRLSGAYVQMVLELGVSPKNLEKSEVQDIKCI